VSIEEYRELDRVQWRDLVKGLILVQAGGYPGAVSISKRFPLFPRDEIDQMARMAWYMVQEHGLQPTIKVDSYGILLGIEKAELLSEEEGSTGPTRTSAEVERAGSPPAHRAPFLRLLQIVHLKAGTARNSAQ
jgi:hypothetical protein